MKKFFKLCAVLIIVLAMSLPVCLSACANGIESGEIAGNGVTDIESSENTNENDSNGSGVVLPEPDNNVQKYVESLKKSSTLSLEPSLSLSAVTDVAKQEIPTDVLTEIEPSAMSLSEGDTIVYKKRTANYGLEDLAYFGANNNITYAGSLLKINNKDNELAPVIGIKRQPLTLSLGVEGAIGVDYQIKKVDTVTQSSVGKAINELIKGVTQSESQLPYVVAMELTEIKAKEELNAALGLGFNVGSFFNFSSSFDFKNKGAQTYALLTLKQIYFTVNVDYDPAKGVYSLIDDSVTLEQMKNACNDNENPVYVSSVSYGRIAAITIRTEQSFSEIEAYLNVGGGTRFISAEMDGKLESLTAIQNYNCNCFVYGGSIDGNQQALNGGSVRDMLKCLNQPYEPSKQVGMPISYQLSNLADSTSSKIGFTGDYYFAEVIKKEKEKIKPIDYYKTVREGYITIYCRNNQVKDVVDFKFNESYEDLVRRGYTKINVSIWADIKEYRTSGDLYNGIAIEDKDGNILTNWKKQRHRGDWETYLIEAKDIDISQFYMENENYKLRLRYFCRDSNYQDWFLGTVKVRITVY